MTDYAAEASSFPLGTALTKRTGSASSDTVPINSRVLLMNGGAGTHVVTFTVTAAFEGLTVPSAAVSIAAGAAKFVRIPGDVGDANGRVAVAIDGTATEVTYYVL